MFWKCIKLLWLKFYVGEFFQLVIPMFHILKRYIWYRANECAIYNSGFVLNKLSDITHLYYFIMWVVKLSFYLPFTLLVFNKLSVCVYVCACIFLSSQILPNDITIYVVIEICIIFIYVYLKYIFFKYSFFDICSYRKEKFNERNLGTIYVQWV